MATFNPGTGGTLKSTTFEGAILELFSLIAGKESDIIRLGDDTYQRKTSYSITEVAGEATYSIGIDLPVLSTIDSSGTLEYQAQEFLSDPPT